MMYGYPMARGTAYRFMSFTFQIIKDMIVYDAMDKDYSIKYNIIRVTIIHTKEEDYDCEAILGEYELDFNYLNNRWRKYDRDDE